ncbi:hypothetical protein STANM309S_06106 [Streptomyces tanashiensis]
MPPRGFARWGPRRRTTGAVPGRDEGGGAGRQDVDSGERGVGGEGGAGGEDGVEGVLARGDPYAFEGEEGGDLGGEAGGAVVRVVVQVERLHAHVVDGEDELRTAGPQVEEGDGEHAVEVFGEGGSVLGVERGEHGAVAAVGEPVAAGGEGAAELGVVVDLAVEDGEDAGQVGQPVGLPAAAGVGDGEPVAAEGPSGPAEHVVLVGSAVALAGGDRRELGRLGAVRPGGEGAEDPAHTGHPPSTSPNMSQPMI